MLQYHWLQIFAHIPACLYSEPLKAIILCVYLVMKGQTVTDGPVFWWKSSMLLVRYCCTLSSRLVSLMERPFTLPVRPLRAPPSRWALSTVSCCLLRSSRYVSAPQRREPPPRALPAWGCGRWLSPPLPRCFRPDRLFLSRETVFLRLCESHPPGPSAIGLAAMRIF